MRALYYSTYDASALFLGRKEVVCSGILRQFTISVFHSVLDKSDPNWWKCRSGTQEGLVPSNYGTLQTFSDLTTTHLLNIHTLLNPTPVGEHTQPLENPLHEASKRGNLPFALELLSAGSSPNSLDRAANTPLHWAVRSGHVEVVRAILGCGKPVQVNAQNKLGDTPLHGGVWGGFWFFDFVDV